MAEDYIKDIVMNKFDELVQEKIDSGACEEAINELINSDTVDQIYRQTLDDFSNESVEVIEQIMFEKVLNENAYVDEFLARQNQKWGKAFVASDVLYLCVLESAEQYTEYVTEVHNGETSFLYHALRNIHGRALQIYLEIMCLNRNGFADGAYARWRSLYELSIVSSFIKKHGEKVAEAYIKSAETNDSYEWARTADCWKDYKGKYVSFNAIQKRCELATKEWKKEYDFVNKLVHASSQGTMYRLGADTAIVLPVGRSDHGMAISAMHSAISLFQITSDFFTVFPHGDSTAAILTFHKLVDRIAFYYKEVEGH